MSDLLYEKDIEATELEGAIVTSINDVEIGLLSDEDFDNMHEKENIKIRIENSEQEFFFQKQDFFYLIYSL